MLKTLIAAFAAFAAAGAFAAVDANKATQAELEAVKGIGPSGSRLILNERKKGEFRNWDDFIARVKGVGDVSARRYSEGGLTINGVSYMPASSQEPSVAERAKDSAKGAASAVKETAQAAASAVKAAGSKTAEAARRVTDKASAATSR